MAASLVGLRKRDCADRAYIVQLKGRSLMVDFAQLANKQPPVAPANVTPGLERTEGRAKRAETRNRFAIRLKWRAVRNEISFLPAALGTFTGAFRHRPAQSPSGRLPRLDFCLSLWRRRALCPQVSAVRQNGYPHYAAWLRRR